MIAKAYVKFAQLSQHLAPLVLLIVRLSWGWESAESGYAGLTHLAHTKSYLNSMHIPYPDAAAIACTSMELIGGWMLMLGLAARFGGLLLAVNYLTLILMGNRNDLVRAYSQSPDGIINCTAWPFFIASLVILALGAGIFSVDALLKKTVFKKHAGSLK